MLDANKLELDLIKRFNVIDKKVQYAKVEASVHISDMVLINKKNELETTYTKLANELKLIINSVVSNERKVHLIQFYRDLICEIDSLRANIWISNNQDTCYDNYFVSMLHIKVEKIIIANDYIFYPPFYLITRDKNIGVDKNVLIDFFNNEISILNNINSINYVVLKAYVNDFKDRLGYLQ